MEVLIKHEDGEKFYQCCSCNVWWPWEPGCMGAFSHNGMYCPTCTEELTQIEVELWIAFMKEHGIANNQQLACLKRTVWVMIGLNSNKVEEASYYG